MRAPATQAHSSRTAIPDQLTESGINRSAAFYGSWVFRGPESSSVLTNGPSFMNSS